MTDLRIYLLAALFCSVGFLGRFEGDGFTFALGLLAAVFLVLAGIEGRKE